MPELNDHDLLRAYARDGSETAFATLVTRYLNLVHSAALRFTSNPDHAEEITQAVFIILARKAGSLGRGVVLAGWLYQTARLTAANFLKSEARRQHREHEAYMQSTLSQSDAEAWEQIAPLLDEAMGHLGENDRNAIVLRFFERRTAQEVASLLNMNEAAAHKRVNRAVDKLRKFFVRRGVAHTTVIIVGVVSANSVQAAPTAFATSISAVAITQGAAASAPTLALVKGTLKLMAWTKLKLGLVLGTAALLATGTAVVTAKQIQGRMTYPWQVSPPVPRKLLDEVEPQVTIVPSKFSVGQTTSRPDGKMIGIYNSVEQLVNVAYSGVKYRVILSTKLPEGHFDFIANLPRGSKEALQAEIKKKFGIVGRHEMRNTEVLLLKIDHDNAPGLKLVADSKYSHAGLENGIYVGNNIPISDLTHLLEYFYQMPVIDQTGLTHKYDLAVKWDGNRESVRKALLDDLGLELAPVVQPLDLLVVEKGK